MGYNPSLRPPLTEANKPNMIHSEIDKIQETNWKRYHRWMEGSPGWSILEAAGELCGEAGELANICKKLRRLELGIAGNAKSATPMDKYQLQEKLRGEIGDVFICLALVASKEGHVLHDCIREAFNKKSEQMGFPERI